DHLPSPKRIRSSEIATDLEVSSDDRFEPHVPRGTDLEMDVDVVRSDEIDIELEIQAEIDKCIAYADALRDKGIDARVVVEAVDREEIGKDNGTYTAKDLLLLREGLAEEESGDGLAEIAADE
nr:hypothetical protein [Tanacetum cinerariifolium]GFC20430.1 hypothetical protein [Tanacetum cinerariifolium]